MKKSIRNTLIATIGVIGVGIFTSCNSFCSASDTSHFRYAYDPINTTFYTSTDSGLDDFYNTFLSNSGLSESQVTLGDLTFNYDNNSSVKYSDNSEEFLARAFTTINDNLVCVNPGTLSVSIKVNETDDNETTYSYFIGLSEFTTSLFTTAQNSNIMLPSYAYFEEVDKKTLELIVETANKENRIISTPIAEDFSNLTFENLYGYSESELKSYRSMESGAEKDALEDTMIKKREQGSLLAHYGYLKHYSVITDENGNETVDYYQRVKDWNDEIGATLGSSAVMSNNFIKIYETNLNNRVASVQTCITVEDGFYGNLFNDPLNSTVLIEGKAEDFWGDWGRAFTEHGFLEGLLVYPIAVGIENLSHALGMNGWGQIGAVLIMTITIRLLFMAITLPSSLSQQKMQLLQPELAKLQQKYPNSDTNQYDKQRLLQAQRALYKKHKVNMWTPFLVMIIQFPLFISVWNAFRGSASLSSDAVLGLKLSDSIWSVLSNFSLWPSNPGWWTALVLIILMSAAQILSIIIPNLLNKRRQKNVAKTVVSEAQTKQAKQTKYMQWGMTIFIVIMGFTLPAAMGVYWFAGAIFSILQTIIMQAILTKRSKKERK